MDCVWRTGVYLPGNPLRIFRGREKAHKDTIRGCLVSQLTMTSVSEETRKPSISTRILLPPRKRQFECPNSEFRRNLAFAVKMMRVVSAEDLPIRLRKGIPQTGPSSNHRVLTESQERRRWAELLFSCLTRTQQIPFDTSCHQETPEKNSTSRTIEIQNIFL